MKSELVTVLDLGSTKTACISACLTKEGALDIKGLTVMPSRGVRKGVVADLEEASAAIGAAVREVQNQTGREVSGLVVGISGQHVEGANSQGFKPIVPRARHITNQDVLEVITHSRSLVLTPDREQIQALPREFRVDGQRDVLKPAGMSGTKLEVLTYVVTGQSAHIQNIERAVSLAGKRVEQMVLGPLASGIGALTQEEMQLGAVIVDIGGGKTDVGIFVKGSMADSQCLPIGGQLVTSDLSKLLKTSPEEAERLKTHYGSALAKIVPDDESIDVVQIGRTYARPLQRKVFCEIVESRMREAATMVAQQIEKSGFKGVLPGGVVLTGGGSRLPGTQRLFEEVLKFAPARIADSSLAGQCEGDKPISAALGMARFAIQCSDDLGPANGSNAWRERVKVLLSRFGART